MTNPIVSESSHGIILPSSEKVRQDVAQRLLALGAVKMAPPDQPFRLTTGEISPIYVDIRLVISCPETRSQLMQAACAHLQKQHKGQPFDVVAGGETAGIPFAAWGASLLHKPMVYVRKKPKTFGRLSAIEGAFKPGSRVLLMEDMATDGHSKVGFVKSLRESGAICEDCLVLFAYGLAGTGQRLQRLGIRLLALCTWHDLLSVATNTAILSRQAEDTVRTYLAERGARLQQQQDLEIP